LTICVFYSDTFIPEHGSLSEKAVKLLKRLTGIATPFFWGVGLLSEHGLLPKSVPLNTVVGEPIDVPRYQALGPYDPKMSELVEEFHGRFLSAMKAMWEAHKDEYAADRRREMCFVE